MTGLFLMKAALPLFGMLVGLGLGSMTRVEHDFEAGEVHVQEAQAWEEDGVVVPAEGLELEIEIGEPDAPEEAPAE